MVDVVNIKTCKDWGREGDVYIGRGSPWGNPFKMRCDCKEERERVISEYEKLYLEGKINISPLLKAKRLGCYCKPKACHGDILKKHIESAQRNLSSIVNGYLDDKRCTGCWHWVDSGCTTCYREE